MKTNFFGRKQEGIASLNEWIDDDNKRKGYTCLNYRFRRELGDINYNLAKCAAIAYVLLVGLGLDNCRSIMSSAAKQRRFVVKVISNVRQFRIEKNAEKMFSRQIRQLNNRVKYIDKIITENLRLSEYFPYFRATGFEQLRDFSLDVPEINNAYFGDLLHRIEEYNKTHSEEVAEYMNSIKDEIETREAFHRRKKEDVKREKDLEKAKIKAANEEVKLLKANKEMHRKREARIDRSFNHLYSDAEAAKRMRNIKEAE